MGVVGWGVACGVAAATGVSSPPAGAVAVGVGVAVSPGVAAGATTTTVPFINGVWTLHSKR